MNVKFVNKKQEMDVGIKKSYCHPYGPKNVVVGLRLGFWSVIIPPKRARGWRRCPPPLYELEA